MALLWYVYLFYGDITRVGWIPPGQENIVKELPLIYGPVYHTLLCDFTLDNRAECGASIGSKLL